MNDIYTGLIPLKLNKLNMQGMMLKEK